MPCTDVATLAKSRCLAPGRVTNGVRLRANHVTFGDRTVVPAYARRMPRALRIQAAGLYHVMTRGNAGDPVFPDPYDRSRFLELVGRIATRLEWRCQAYCVLTNRYHLVVAVPEATLSRGLEWLNGTYAPSFNLRHGSEDHVFGKRFRSVEIEAQGHLLEVVRHVARNPVRAGVCSRPSEGTWSSFPAVAGMTTAPRYLAADDVLGLFGRSRASARSRFADFVDDVAV
jgi:putative transposase